MTRPRFEWDEAKNLSNQRKHGLRFEEAIQVFRDPLHVTLPDRVVDGEERWQTYGYVRGTLLLLVVHTICEANPSQIVLRVISARRATAQERRKYEEENS